MEPAPAILAAADGAPTLPRLGGMARPDGVVIVSERFWAHARTDGSLLQGSMPRLPGFLRRVPVIRGLARLALAFAPLLARSGVQNRGERRLLAVCVLSPLPLALLPAGLQLALGLVIGAALVAWLFRGRTLFLHGAEHRAIRASETGRLVATWEGSARPSRYSRRCGTNFAALVLLTTVALYAFLPATQDGVWSFPLGVGALGATMELWFLIQALPARAGGVMLAPGLALQRLTTREPGPSETRLALRAVASVLERELAR